MDLSILKQLIELGWPAIITAFFAYLAVNYINDQRNQIQYLRTRIDELEKQLIAVKHEVDIGKTK